MKNYSSANSSTTNPHELLKSKLIELPQNYEKNNSWDSRATVSNPNSHHGKCESHTIKWFCLTQLCLASGRRSHDVQCLRHRSHGAESRFKNILRASRLHNAFHLQGVAKRIRTTKAKIVAFRLSVGLGQKIIRGIKTTFSKYSCNFLIRPM